MVGFETDLVGAGGLPGGEVVAGFEATADLGGFGVAGDHPGAGVGETGKAGAGLAIEVGEVASDEDCSAGFGEDGVDVSGGGAEGGVDLAGDVEADEGAVFFKGDLATGEEKNGVGVFLKDELAVGGGGDAEDAGVRLVFEGGFEA